MLFKVQDFISVFFLNRIRPEFCNFEILLMYFKFPFSGLSYTDVTYSVNILMVGIYFG